jgi:hypothetical protein
MTDDEQARKRSTHLVRGDKACWYCNSKLVLLSCVFHHRLVLQDSAYHKQFELACTSGGYGSSSLDVAAWGQTPQTQICKAMGSAPEYAETKIYGKKLKSSLDTHQTDTHSFSHSHSDKHILSLSDLQTPHSNQTHRLMTGKRIMRKKELQEQLTR